MNTFNERIELSFRDYRKASIYFISLFSGWFLAVSFQGPVLIGHMEELGFIASKYFITSIVFSHFIGLLLAGRFIKPDMNFKLRMHICMVACLFGNLLLFLPFSTVWQPAMVVTSFFAGFVIAGWGNYYNRFAPSGKKIVTAASVIVSSNIIMIVLIGISLLFSSLIGLIVSSVSLFASYFIFFKCMPKNETKLKTIRKEKTDKVNVKKAFFLLYIFVTLLSISSGFMYHIINLSFIQEVIWVSFYWALPYVVVVSLFVVFHERLNMSYVLYGAIMLIGVGYIINFILEQSTLSYIIVITLLLGAYGVCDLFWWTMFGELLAFSENPAKNFGLGLSANVLGIAIGILAGQVLYLFDGSNINPIIIALIIVFLTLFSLPMLYNKLSFVLDKKGFLVGLSNISEEKNEKGSNESQEDRKVNDFLNSGGLTEREVEIAKMLYRGLTYKAIAQNLSISENTVKTHVKSVYSKLEVKSKSGLMEMIHRSFQP